MTSVANMEVTGGSSGEKILYHIWSSPHFHTCAHLARAQVWLSACWFWKVTIIGRIRPALSKHLKGAFHHFKTVQTALLREYTVALTQTRAQRAIIHCHTVG